MDTAVTSHAKTLAGHVDPQYRANARRIARKEHGEGQGGYFVPPLWLIDEYIPCLTSRPQRPRRTPSYRERQRRARNARGTHA